MYLKSIEINGFKSFANKIVFEFPHGITASLARTAAERVISATPCAGCWANRAPNSCGAPGWRTSSSPARRAADRWALPYVAIVFDNADRKIALDYDEVKVARRVYRSGER